MTLDREPDAGNLPVRFDEREVETEHGMRLKDTHRGNPKTELCRSLNRRRPPLNSTLARQCRRTAQAVERGVLLSSGPLVDVGSLLRLCARCEKPAQQAINIMQLRVVEADCIRHALAWSDSIEEASERLGINASTLYRKRKRYGIWRGLLPGEKALVTCSDVSA